MCPQPVHLRSSRLATSYPAKMSHPLHCMLHLNSRGTPGWLLPCARATSQALPGLKLPGTHSLLPHKAAPPHFLPLEDVNSGPKVPERFVSMCFQRVDQSPQPLRPGQLVDSLQKGFVCAAMPTRRTRPRPPAPVAPPECPEDIPDCVVCIAKGFATGFDFDRDGYVNLGTLPLSRSLLCLSLIKATCFWSSFWSIRFIARYESQAMQGRGSATPSAQGTRALTWLLRRNLLRLALLRPSRLPLCNALAGTTSSRARLQSSHVQSRPPAMLCRRSSRGLRPSRPAMAASRPLR